MNTIFFKAFLKRTIDIVLYEFNPEACSLDRKDVFISVYCQTGNEIRFAMNKPAAPEVLFRQYFFAIADTIANASFPESIIELIIRVS